MEMDSLGPPKKPTSAWTYVGCTCGALVVLFLFAIAGMTFLAYRQGKEMKETFTDPAKREAKTREALGYRELPPGYFPGGAISIPFAMDMAILSDREPVAGAAKPEPDFKERGFLYFSLRDFGKNRAEMEAYVQGKGPKPGFMEKNGTDLDEGELLQSGALDVHGQRILYRAMRGTLAIQGKDHRGLTCLAYIPCAGDSRLRFGLWFGPDPAEGQTNEELDLKGTPADPAAIADFLGRFELCPKP